MHPVFKFWSIWNLKLLVFMEGGKTENLEKGIEPRSQRWKASAYPLRYAPPNLLLFINNL